MSLKTTKILLKNVVTKTVFLCRMSASVGSKETYRNIKVQSLSSSNTLWSMLKVKLLLWHLSFLGTFIIKNPLLDFI